MFDDDDDDDIGVTPAFYRVREVLKITALSRATIYRRMQQGRFPPPIHLSERVRAWPKAVLEAWIADPENYRAPQLPDPPVRRPGGRPRKFVQP